MSATSIHTIAIGVTRSHHVRGIHTVIGAPIRHVLSQVSIGSSSFHVSVRSISRSNISIKDLLQRIFINKLGWFVENISCFFLFPINDKNRLSWAAASTANAICENEKD